MKVLINTNKKDSFKNLVTTETSDFTLDFLDQMDLQADEFVESVVFFENDPDAGGRYTPIEGYALHTCSGDKKTSFLPINVDSFEGYIG